MKLKSKLRRAENKVLNLDHRTHEHFKTFAESRPAEALHVLSKLGDQPELRTIAGALLATGIFADSDRLVRAGARMIIAHEAATAVKGRDEKKPKKGNQTAKEMTSFPSGHSAGAIAAARAFSREYPEYGGAAVAAATLIALLQIPRCAHYPSDVAAGLGSGFAAEAAVDAAWQVASMDERSSA